MKKTTKKILSVALATVLACGLMACDKAVDPAAAVSTSTSTSTTSTSTADTSTSTPDAEPAAPEVTKIVVMVDGTFHTEATGRDADEAALEALMGVDIQFIQPDHSGYAEVLSQTFANSDTSTWPDVVLMPAAYYATYANNGVLVDISDYWENSDIVASGRVKSMSVIDGLYFGDALYGISPAAGNGCITYTKKHLLDAVGMDVPTNYEEYCAYLQAICDYTGSYAVTSAGIMNGEAPYTNYLPEFFQDAYPDFYEKDGVWVDGFTEQAMIDALERLVEAYDNGWLDPEAVTNSTKDARTKFWSTPDTVGLFTYWAGTWTNNIVNNINASADYTAAGYNGADDLVLLPPIAELGAYTERIAPVWGITSACKNPEKVFDLFFGTMLDGGEGQVIWQYGTEGTHWSTAAETVTYNTGDKEVSNTYEAGQFHYLVNTETQTALFAKNHIDPLLAIVEMNGTDPGASANNDITLEGEAFFNANKVAAHMITSNDVMTQYESELVKARQALIANVVMDGKSITDAMAEYKADYGDKVQAILDSLNK